METILEQQWHYHEEKEQLMDIKAKDMLTKKSTLWDKMISDHCIGACKIGPKAFQRHFAQWCHAHGMRCLGIPNTAHFANMTQIEDAVSLWAKLKLQKASERWRPDTEEEYEDLSGNVVNKKTYEDLKRQGLL
ncbi:Splicing factor 3A subunit 3 [Plecturocebus cupreus]